MASDLKQKAEAISAIGKQPLPAEPEINVSQLLSGVGTQLYSEIVQNNANEYLNKVEQIKALNLGEDETQKRLSGMADKNPYLSMMSPVVRQQQRNLKRESSPAYKQIKAEAAMDRIKESLAINDLSTIRNSAATVDEFKTKASQLRKDTEETLKRGASAEFNREFSSRYEYGITSIPTMASLRRGVISDKELVNSFIRGSTNEFMDAVRKTGRQSPTIQELSYHFDQLVKQAVETGQGLNEVRRALIDLLSNQPDIKLAEAAFKKYPNFFDQGEITKSIPEAIKNRNKALGQNALPLTAIDTEVRAFNRVGRPSLHISPDLVTLDSDREAKAFVDKRALHYLSPEKLDVLVETDPEYAKDQDLISKIKNAFREDFQRNVGSALVERGRISPNQWVELSGISLNAKGIPIVDEKDFFRSLENRAKVVAYWKNIYQGTDAIENLSSDEESALIAQALSRMEPVQAWNFSYRIFSTINKVNQDLAPGQKTVDALNNMRRLIQDDPILVTALGMADSAPEEAYNTYITLKHSEKRNSKEFESLRAISTAEISNKIRLGTRGVPDSVRYAAADYLTANHIMNHGVLLNEQKIFLTDKIQSFSVGNTGVLIYSKSRMKLDRELKRKIFKYQGKNQNLYNLVYSGKIMLENAPYSMNKFYLRVPRDNIDAISNISNYYIDPKTKKPYEISIDPRTMESDKGIFEYVSGWFD